MIELYSNGCLYKDVYTIIEMMSPELRNRISKNFIEFLKLNQDNEFEGTINKNIPLKNQELREEIKIMLSMIYISYICSEEKRKEILELDEKNINEFYNRPIFQKKDEILQKEDLNNSQETATLQMVEYKESFWKKIFVKIKHMLFR